MIDLASYVREPREQFALKLTCCTCGGFAIRIVAAQEICFTDCGYKINRPVYIEVCSTEPNDCPKPVEHEAIVLSSLTELREDIFNALKSLDKQFSPEAIEQIDMILEGLSETLQDVYVSEFATPN